MKNPHLYYKIPVYVTGCVGIFTTETVSEKEGSLIDYADLTVDIFKETRRIFESFKATGESTIDFHLPRELGGSAGFKDLLKCIMYKQEKYKFK